MTESADAAVKGEDVASWLRRNAIPIVPGGPDQFRELEPLREILRDATIVGVAEATHGTREFYEFKHRMLRFLVTEMDFTVLAIEASRSAADAINAYVTRGEGDRAAAVTALGLVMWDVEEFISVLDWLRQHNAGLPERRKVGFLGLDIWNTSVSRAYVLAYLRRLAPERVYEVERMFADIGCAESLGMMRAHERLNSRWLSAIDRLLEYLVSHRAALVTTESRSECDRSIQHVRLIQRWVIAMVSDEVPHLLPSGVPATRTLNNFARSLYMAQNLIEQMEHERVDARVVVWAHIFHLAFGYEAPAHGMAANMGHQLRERFGSRFYALGLELGEGTYLARAVQPDNTLGDFSIGTVRRGKEGALSNDLERAGLDAFLLDLRGPASSAVREWLSTPRAFHAISWVHRESANPYTDREPGNTCDGIAFFGHTHPTTPTGNARLSVASRTAY